MGFQGRLLYGLLRHNLTSSQWGCSPRSGHRVYSFLRCAALTTGILGGVVVTPFLCERNSGSLPSKATGGSSSFPPMPLKTRHSRTLRDSEEEIVDHCANTISFSKILAEPAFCQGRLLECETTKTEASADPTVSTQLSKDNVVIVNGAKQSHAKQEKNYMPIIDSVLSEDASGVKENDFVVASFGANLGPLQQSPERTLTLLEALTVRFCTGAITGVVLGHATRRTGPVVLGFASMGACLVTLFSIFGWVTVHWKRILHDVFARKKASFTVKTIEGLVFTASFAGGSVTSYCYTRPGIY